jgi:hypothetical protein
MYWFREQTLNLKSIHKRQKFNVSSSCMNLVLNLSTVLLHLYNVAPGVYDLLGPPYKWDICNYKPRESNTNNIEPPGQGLYSHVSY